MNKSSASDIDRGRELLKQLTDFCHQVSDAAVGEVLDEVHIREFVESILDTSKSAIFPSIAEFYLANKFRGATIARLRLDISQTAAIVGKKDDKTAFVSPHAFQWFDDGVMLLEGPNPFEGFIMLYRGGELKCGIAARSIPAGKEIEPSDLEFVGLEQANKQLKDNKVPPIERLDAPAIELEKLLNANESNEKKYQELFERFPWSLGNGVFKVATTHQS
jgi:hypothetical protein